MKKIQTPSLTAAQFYMKRLYKYIWFWVKVFQNVCLPPHWRVDFVTRPPMALILLLQSRTRALCSDNYPLSPRDSRWRVREVITNSTRASPFSYKPLSSKVHHGALETALGTTRLGQMTGQWQPREYARKYFGVKFEWKETNNICWIGGWPPLWGGIKGRICDGRRWQGGFHLWIMALAYRRGDSESLLKFSAEPVPTARALWALNCFTRG